MLCYYGFLEQNKEIVNAIVQSVLLTLYGCTQLPVMCKKLALGSIIQTHGLWLQHFTLSVAT
jgi:hypothetical protein